MKKKRLIKIIGISVLLIIVICIVIFTVWIGYIFSKQDLDVTRTFYSPNENYVAVDYTDCYGRNTEGSLHIYSIDEYELNSYSQFDKDALWYIDNYSDFSYGGPYLIKWLDNENIRVDDKCFNVIEGKYVDNYIPTYPFYSTAEFYSPDKKHVVVNCTKEEETGISGVIVLYEAANYESFIESPEMIFTDSNYIKIIEDPNRNFGTAYGGNPYRIKWLDNENIRIENSKFNIVEGKIIKEY